jgi:hypothetical protein
VSVLQRGDEGLHYSDGAHRWSSPTGDNEEAWRTRIEAHVAAHRESPEAGRTPGPRLRPGKDAFRKEGTRP